MSKNNFESILFLLLIVSFILLLLIISDPGEEFSDFIDNLSRSQYKGPVRDVKLGDNNIGLIKNFINGLTLFSCTCLICLSYLVSKK